MGQFLEKSIVTKAFNRCPKVDNSYYTCNENCPISKIRQKYSMICPLEIFGENGLQGNVLWMGQFLGKSIVTKACHRCPKVDNPYYACNENGPISKIRQKYSMICPLEFFGENGLQGNVQWMGQFLDKSIETK